MYTDFYGLNALPFSIAPDPRFLYPSTGHQEALAHLQYALTDQGGLVCLTGEVGMGKTMLCRHFIEQLPDDVLCAYVFNPQLNATELLIHIGCELGFWRFDEEGSHSASYWFDRLYHGLLDCYAQGKRVICLIDEAQTIPVPVLEQIRLLTNLETDQHKLMTLILVGQSELNDILARHDMRQLNQRITARSHLSTLSESDAKAYLQFRLNHVGGQDLFTSKASSLLWRASGGVPRLLNAMADRALLGGYAQNTQRIDHHITQKAIDEVQGKTKPTILGAGSGSGGLRIERLMAWLGLSMAVFVLVWVFRDQLLDVEPPQQASISAPVAKPEPTAGPLLKPSAVSAQRQALELLVSQLADRNPLPLNQAQSCQSFNAYAKTRNSLWYCHVLDWPLAELRALNRPVVIATATGLHLLSDNDQAEHYLGRGFVLWQLPSGYQSLIRVGDRSEVVAWVRARLGLPVTPATTKTNDILAGINTQGWQTISPSAASGSESGGGQASQSTNTPPEPTQRLDAQYYDRALARMVAAYQRRAGLKPDRILGPDTLLALSRLTPVRQER